MGLWLTLTLSAFVWNSCTSPDEIRVLCFGSYSGVGSDLDLAGRDGMRMAVDRINRDGGIHGQLIRLKTVDIQDDPDLFQKSMTLYRDSGYQIMVTPFRSRFAQASLKQAKHTHVLILNATMTANMLYQRDDALFNLSPNAASQGSDLAQYIQNKQLNPFWIVVNDNNREYTHDVLQGIESTLSKSKHTWIKQSLMGNVQEQLVQVADSIARSKPAAVIMLLSGAEAGLLSQYLRVRNYKGAFLGARWTTTGELIERGGAAVEGLVASTSSMKQTDARKMYDADFQRVYGRIPSFAAHVGYDLIQVLANSLVQTKSIKPEALKTELINHPPYEGISGEIDFDQNGDLIRSSELTVVRNGNFVELE